MGLSRKLGGGNNPRVNQPVSNAVPYKWSNQTYTVQEIFQKFKLPCVVQCATDSCSVLWSDFQFDLCQPLLFYSQRTAKKVHTASLKRGGELEEVGPPMAIPHDYDGWFGAAPKGVNKCKRHFRIESIANLTTRRFLVTSQCPAFTSTRGVDGDIEYVPHDVLPGEVLKRVCVMESTDPDCPQLVKDHGPCLECLDEKDEAVIIPFKHRALCYEIAEAYPDDEEKIFQISSVIKAGNSNLPRILTHIHGDPPQLAYAFTGLIRCYSVYTEETLLAATLDDPESICLEMATDSSAKFRLALNEAAVKKTCEYNNALFMCETRGAKFVSGMKVSFALTPEPSDLGDIDLSFYESTSDMQEIEANSEFEIAWGSVKKARLLMASASNSEHVENVTSEDSATESEKPREGKSQREDNPNNLKPKVSDGSDTSLPQHRDFTEQEIADLMQRKGLVEKSELRDDSSQDIESLKENRVTDNPLFYFFQRNPEQNPFKTLGQEKEEQASDDDEEEGSLTPTNDHVEKENPLSYLFQRDPVSSPVKSPPSIPLSNVFEQNSESTPHETDPQTENPLDKAEDSVTTMNALENPHATVSASSSTLSQYKRAECKKAKEYDEDEEDEVSDMSNGEESDIFSDFEEVPQAIKDLAFYQEAIMPSDKHTISAESFTSTTPEYVKLSTASPDFCRSKHPLSAPLDLDLDPNKNENQSASLSHQEESEAVDDLLFLAETESNKNSTQDLSVNANDSRILEHKNSNECHASSSSLSGSYGTIPRLNSLLAEVSSLVNASSGRILDIRKGSQSRQVTNSSSSSPNQALRSPTASSHQETSKSASLSSPSHSSARNGKEDVAPTTEDRGSSIKHPDFNFDTKKTETQVVTSLPRQRKSSKVDNFVNFYSGLDSTKSKSDDFSSALKRSKIEPNLTSVGQREAKQPSPKELLKTFQPDSGISSIFGFEKDKGNRFESSRVTHHPHEHPHRQTSDREDSENEFGRPQSSGYQKGEQMSTFQKGPGSNSFNRGNVLASVQNFERLSSPNSSISSSNRSSISNSFRQTSPHLVVISDASLTSHADGYDQESETTAEHYSDHQQLPAASKDFTADDHGAEQNSDDEDVFAIEEHFHISKSGKVKPGKFTKSQKSVLLPEFMKEDSGEEDFV